MSPLLLRILTGWIAMGAPGLSAPAVPSEAERDESVVPVLLVPGWGDHAASMEPLRRRLTAAGWPESRVSVLSFRDPVGSNESHAAEIDRAVRVLRGLTGEPRVDVLAHSMGGLATRQFLLEGEEALSVRRAVFLGTPHRGTVVAVLSWGEGGREMVPGSAFLNRLNSAPAIPEGVLALAIRTPLDLRVIPASSAILRGERVENVEICCPTHTGLVDDDRTFEEVVAFLRPVPVPRVEVTGAPSEGGGH
jgi:triacylglycerol lipase